MKIAVLSDIHGNVPALDAVLTDIECWQPDEVVVNGDLVNRGPLSLECLRMVQVRMPRARLLRGNHERFVLDCVEHAPDPASATYDLDRMALWTARQLGEQVETLRHWEAHFDLAGLEGGASFHITHGSRLGDRDGIHPEIDDAELARKLGEPRALFVSSHTHRAFMRSFNNTWVVNTGSVGQPMDGDERAAYGQFTFQQGRWQTQLVRVAFDRMRAEQDFYSSGFAAECGPIVQLIIRELREARAHIAPWRRRYLSAIKAGEISVAAAVAEYLL